MKTEVEIDTSKDGDNIIIFSQDKHGAKIDIIIYENARTCSISVDLFYLKKAIAKFED